MVLGIFGESCTGKSTLAKYLSEQLKAEVFTGKDYLRLAKGEAEAKRQFARRLENAVTGPSIIYVMSEKPDLLLLPDQAVRILVTADLDTIKSRFAARMNGKLPGPVAQMLERRHGCFDKEPCLIHVVSGVTDYHDVWEKVSKMK